ncbi:AN1-type zinc finger protein 4-like [Carassius gibelio]|uniref:AN1-type zinc finger protein 4-like n=1 Tax=Carassius gibelio TaxID=101364 RepID=UPI0022782BD2|nr:AN1-type zinc finger protein 4-like [Carassius gibelio]XP_052428114.1 AN1-type zinc finger protein 4-like [Carassius gibelio]XP_052428115.1 AN1-type zinc finger protein 4-like [Carassius gibelio]XP_052428116.1 AN1-type zinc finger protein 4-like [Carassius gibelio]
MTDKRNPPFFNDGNVGVLHYKLPFSETMELFIETLTGTCFQLRVSPFEQVVSVKAKIQRLEGIPVSQQHLIWNGMELEDEYCLHDYSITEGCTLKLVLAMRGGPVNTRRVTVTDDSVRDITDCLGAGREEMWEKSLPNKQVTFLVYREGDQLNIFRVVDRGDGTLTPVSESLSGASVHNVYAEEEEETESGASEQQTLENSITMSKMKLLKAKMENMNLNKKPKKTAKLKVRPPVGPRPCSGSLGSARHHRMFRVLPQIGHASPAHLPPIGDQQQPAVSSPAAGSSRQQIASLSSLTSSSHAYPSSSASGVYMLQAEEPWDNPVPRKIRLPPKVSRLDMRGPKVMRDCVYPPVSLLSNSGVQEEVDLQGDRLTVAENSAVIEPPKAVPFNLPEPLSLDISTQRERGLNSITVPEPNTAAPLLSQALNSNWLASQSDPLTPPQMPQHFEFTGSSSPSQALLRASNSPSVPVSSPSRTTSVCGLKVDKHSEVISKSEARDITKMANKATKEPLGSVSNAELLASLAGGGGQEALAGPFALGRLCATAAPLPTNIHLLQKDLLRRISPLQRAAGHTPSSSSGGLSSSVKRLGTPTHHLPPVKVPSGTKKKSSKHCFLCGKKTGLATSYECRCGNIFCSMHRYSETHDCTYDYKSAGRRFLQETNPIINAPKLPKI